MNAEAATDFEQPRVRQGRGHRSVFTVFGLTLAAAFVGGMLIYFKFVAYGRVAARHLPEDTALAARIDVETLLVAGPVRNHLLPLFDQGLVGRSDLKARHDRFRAHTGVELARDLHEIVLGSSPGGWVLVFGGKFPKSGLVAGLGTTLTEERTPVALQGDVLQVQNGPAIGQASDGALVVASDADRLRAALRGSDAYLRLGLPPEGAGGFALQVGTPAPPGFAQFERVAGSLLLGDQLLADVAVHLRPGASAEPAQVALAFATLGAAAPPASAARQPLEHAEIQAASRGRGRGQAELDGRRAGGRCGMARRLLRAQLRARSRRLKLPGAGLVDELCHQPGSGFGTLRLTRPDPCASRARPTRGLLVCAPRTRAKPHASVPY